MKKGILGSFISWVKAAQAKDPAVSMVAGGSAAQMSGDMLSLANSLKQATEKEQAILSYASDVICSFDLAGRCMSMNPACQRLWGYAPEELIGGDIFAIIAGVDRQQLVGHLQSVHVKKGPGEYELKVCRKDGSLADTLWSLYWSVENEWIVGVVHDITARKLGERQQAEFDAMVWHDLRSPLATVQMFLQSLEAELWGASPPAVLTNAAKTRVLVDRLIRLTDDLLSYQRIESGELLLNMEDIDLNLIIDESIHAVSGLAQQNHVAIDFQPRHLTLVADRARLVQVFTNLLSNAIKFSPAHNKVEVTVSEDATSCVVQVSDRGPGVSDENKGLVFEKFKQVSGSDSDKGAGLGLAICRKYVEYHGGRIGVADRADGGSVFWVKLPKLPKSV